MGLDKAFLICCTKFIYMKLFKKFFYQKGFTLIELLVVIGILGILATGLLATIDPLEQFRKGTDSNARQTATELVNAITRYYAVHSAFPWDTVPNGGAGCNAGANPSALQVTTATGTTSFDNCLTQLQTEGELKGTFSTQYGILKNLWITDTTVGTSKSLAVCFPPASKSLSKDPATKYNQNASTSPACTPPNCYWCSQ